MPTKDSLFSSIISDFKRLDFNDAYKHMTTSFERYSPRIDTRELGTENSILHAMAVDKDIEAEVLIRLSKEFPKDFLINEVNAHGNTVVDLLIKEQKSVHLILLEKEGPLNLASYKSNGNNALHLAAVRDNPVFINFLLNKGVTSEQKNKKNLTPIDIARRYGTYGNVEILESYHHTKNIHDDNFLDLGR